MQQAVAARLCEDPHQRDHRLDGVTPVWACLHARVGAFVTCSAQNAVHSMQCTAYRNQCKACSVQNAVYSMQCTAYSVQHTVYSMHWTACSVQHTVSAQHAGYGMLCTAYVLYSIQCTHAASRSQCIDFLVPHARLDAEDVHHVLALHARTDMFPG